jgi:PAS domain S-box-containing protein
MSSAGEPRSILASLLDLVPDAAVVVDVAGNITTINSRAATLFGYCEEELTGEVIETLVPERLRHGHRDVRTNYVSDPCPRSMGAGLDLYGRRKHGTEFPVDISLAPVEVEGQPLVVAAIRDVSEQRAANAAQAQLAGLVRSSHDAIIGLTLQGEVTSWNPGAERLLNLSAAEMIGSHVSRLVPKDQSASFEDLLDGAVRSRHTHPLDTQWLTGEGDKRDVAISVSPIEGSEGRITGFSVVLRDITERKRSEAALRLQERWQSAMAEIRLNMLANEPLDSSLDAVCRHVVDLVRVDAAAIMTITDDGARVNAQYGLGEGIEGALVELDKGGDTPIDEAVYSVCAELMPEVERNGRVLQVVPIPSERESAALMLVLPESQPDIGTEDRAILESLATQGALAIELTSARADREKLLLTGDRERIARDLHDLVIQRLFGAGMGLQGSLPLIGNSDAASRVRTAIDDLDATIREIRSAIFALESPAPAGPSIRAEVLATAAAAAEHLGFEPSVRFTGPVDTAVTTELATHILAVVREALSNAARHAHATQVTVDLNVDSEEIVVSVIDNGGGMSDSSRESGLANLRTRAESSGGSFRLKGATPQGLHLAWRVPLHTN